MTTTQTDVTPPEIRLVTEFLNTVDLEHDRDQFGTPGALGTWLRDRFLLRDGEPDPTAEEYRLALNLREALRDLAEVNAGGDARACIDRLNEAATRGSMIVMFDEEGRAHLHASAPGVGGALGRIMAAVFRAMVAEFWPRLKICKMHSCRWAFYDTSRNRSGTWCSMRICGNRAKVRSYRARRETASA